MEKLSAQEIEIFRKMSPAKKLKIANDMYFTAYRIKYEALKQKHAAWSEKEIKKEISRIFSYAGK